MSVLQSNKKSKGKIIEGKIDYASLPRYTPVIPIERCNKIIKCDDMIGFHNEHSSCWSIVVLTFMLHSHITGCDFQSKISKRDYDYSEERLKHYFPSNKVLDCMFKREYIPVILDAIRERIINKHEEQLSPLEPHPIAKPLVRSSSEICESNMLKAYFNFFGYDGSKVFADGANKYTTFLFMNLLSKIVLNRFINIDIYGEYDIIFSDNAIGYNIGIPGHAIGIFKCDNGKYFIVDNNYLFPFKFNEFVAKYNECKAIEDAAKLQERMDKQKGLLAKKRFPSFDLMYNRKHGVVIMMANGEIHSFTSHKIEDSNPLVPILDVKKYTLYTGDDNKYKHSSNIITYYYSVEARIIESTSVKNIVDVKTLKDEITQIDRQYNKSDTLLMTGIKNNFFEEHFDLFTYLVTKHHPNLNITNMLNETMLHLAVIYNCPQIFKYLIEHKANLDIKTNNGFTPIDILSRIYSTRPIIQGIYDAYSRTRIPIVKSVISNKQSNPIVNNFIPLEKQDRVKGNKKQNLVQDALRDDTSRVNASRNAKASIKAEREYFDDFEKKYLKYKLKYHQLKKQLNL